MCLGGVCTGPTVLLFAASSGDLLAGTFHPASGWSTVGLADSSTTPASVTVDATGTGVGVYSSLSTGFLSASVWSNGAWGAPATVSSAIVRAQPYLDATGVTTGHLVYQDDNYQYWHLSFTGGTWGLPGQAIGTGSDQSYGPQPATIASVGGGATIAFIDGSGPNVNYAASRDLVGGTWQARVDPGPSGNFNISPTIIPLNGGTADAMMVYVQCSDPSCNTGSATQIYSMTRTSGTWSSPAAITNALTARRVALAPLPSGGAILAFQGTDGMLYWSTYAAGAWSMVAPFSTPNVSVDDTPAVAHGIGGDVAEIAYVTSGNAYHARLGSGGWSSPASVGGGGKLFSISIASAP